MGKRKLWVVTFKHDGPPQERPPQMLIVAYDAVSAVRAAVENGDGREIEGMTAAAGDVIVVD